MLDLSEFETGLDKAVFDEKKIYFNEHLEDVIASTNNCIANIDDDVEETDKDEQAI